MSPQRAEVTELVGTGTETLIPFPFRPANWQIQERDGTPLMRVHYGRELGDKLVVPAVARGFKYQVLFVERKQD